MKNKGLSIVIPVYNFSISDLVTVLDEQASSLNISYEIRCYDDCSDTYFKELNTTITKFENVIYKELPLNHGRSKIRNLLANDAKYDTLLFLDSDSKITNANYLIEYVKYLDKDAVVYGGRSYQNTPPTNSNKILHWKYGSTRETTSAEIRSKSPYYTFMSNNFIVPKNFFLKVKMDETLKGYGYEDTLFGVKLKEFNISIKHIDNPLCHIGLEDNDAFLQKTYESIKNLFQLTSANIQFNTKLYKYYRFITKSQLIFLFGFVYKLFQEKIEKNLKSTEPTLFYFDLYKLNLIITEHTTRSVKANH